MALDLCLDDFNDEDLSDILQDKELHQSSYANDSFKVAKRRAAGRRTKRTTSDSLLNHTNLNYTRPKSMHGTGYDANRRPRPTTLRFFAEPARPGPLVKQVEIAEPSDTSDKTAVNASQQPEDAKEVEIMSRLRQSYSEETIKNNNIEQSYDPTKETKKNSPKTALCRVEDRKSPKQNTTDVTQPISEDHKTVLNAKNTHQPIRRYTGLTRSASEWSIEDPDKVEYCYINGELKEQTHMASFKFVPRHADEIHLEINDPLHVSNQADDFWCEGINMRTGQQGIFPAYYAQSLFEDGDDVSVFSLKDDNCERFDLYFLGSVEVAYHKGNDVLCEAMRRVALARKNTLHKMPPAFICLFVNSHGIKMMDQSQIKQVPQKPFSSSVQMKERTHFFQLRNVSFCGQHPRNDKYFAFITRHPDFFSRFACHVFVSETSTRPLAESVGRAFASFYREFMECAHPAEDIYIE